MADIGKKVIVEYARVKKDLLLTDAVLKAAGEAAAAVANDLIRKRTMLGYDIESKRFKKYSYDYSNAKANYISGQGKLRKQYKPLDRFAAKNVRDVGRLSGRYFAGASWSKVKVDRSGASIKLTWNLSLSNQKGPSVGGKKKRSSPSPFEKHQYLWDMGYRIYGLATAGKFLQSETKELLLTVKRILKLNNNARGQVKDQ